MPRLMKVFSSLGQDLPLPTRILLKISALASTWWVWVILAALAAFVYSRLKTPAAQQTAGRLVLSVPVMGKLVRMADLGRFCRTMEVLIKSGIPILRAIDVSLPVVGNPVLRKELQAGLKSLEQGGSFGRILKSSPNIPAFMGNLLVVGEESGKLTNAFSEIAYSYEHDTDEAIRAMTSLVEPLLILGMGLVVGFIVMAMLLPVFEINLAVR
jgi:type II secretory pathway component PulF